MAGANRPTSSTRCWSNRELVLLHQRNHSALEELTNNERHHAENDDIEQQFRRVLESPAIPLAQRVRMACSLGAVVGALVGGETLFGDVPIEELAEHVRARRARPTGCGICHAGWGDMAMRGEDTASQVKTRPCRVESIASMRG